MGRDPCSQENAMSPGCRILWNEIFSVCPAEQYLPNSSCLFME